jgi:hypothetical protein
LWFVFNLRDHDAPRWRNEITQNQWLWGAILLCILLVAAAVYLPGLSDVLQTVAPVGVGWLVVLGLSALPAVVGLFVPGIRFHADTNRQSTPAAVEDSEDRLAKLENKVDENRESVEVLRRQIDSAETNEGKGADQSETRDGSPKSDGAAPSK